MGKSVYFVGEGERKVEVSKGMFLAMQHRTKKEKLSRMEGGCSDRWGDSSCGSPKSCSSKVSAKTTKTIKKKPVSRISKG